MKRIFYIVLLLGVLSPLRAFAVYPGECVVVQAGVRGAMSYNNYDYTLTANTEAGTISVSQGPYTAGTLNTVYLGIWYYEDGIWKGKTNTYRSTTAPEGNYGGYENRFPDDPVNASHNRDIAPIGDCNRCPDPDEEMIDGVCVPLPKCVDETEAANAECGTGNWTWGDEDNCLYVCKPCTGDGEKTESELTIECDGLGGVLFYDAEECQGACRNGCTEADVTKAEEACGKLSLNKATWSNVTCDAYCNGCSPDHIQQAITDCEQSGATLDESSYTCTATPERGIELFYNCEGDNSVIYPPPPQPTPDNPTEQPESTPDPSPPSESSDDPTDENPETNQNLLTDYLKGLKENSDTEIENDNTTNKLLENIGKNLETSVKNQGILNESIKNIDGSGVSALLGKLFREMVGIEGGLKKVEDGIDELKDGYETANDEYSGFEEQTLLDEELTTLGQNFETLKTEITDAIGVDLNGSSGLPSWVLPTPFGDFDIDLNDYQFVFDALGNVVLFAAYLSGAIIIFG